MSKAAVIYTSNTCAYCAEAKEILKLLECTIEEKNINTDPSHRAELIAMGYRSVPVILIDGNIIVGFGEESRNRVIGLCAE